jgi:hypothetical protein
MPVSKKPRKKFRARVLSNAAAHLAVIVNSKPIDYSDATTLANRIRTAYEALKNGSSDIQDYDRVAWALNVAYERAKEIDDRLTQIVGVVGDVLEKARERFDRYGRFGFAGDELQAMNRGMDVYEEILRNSSPRQMHDADARVAKWVEQIHAVRAQRASP